MPLNCFWLGAVFFCGLRLFIRAQILLFRQDETRMKELTHILFGQISAMLFSTRKCFSGPSQGSPVREGTEPVLAI